MTYLILLLLIGLTLAQAVQLRAYINDTNYTDPSSTQVLSVISTKSNFGTVSPDGKILLLHNSATNSIGVYDVSNLQSPTLSSSINFASSSQGLVSAVISPDSKTGYIVHDNQGTGELLIVDLSDILSPVTLSTFSLYAGTGPIVLSPDGQTIFVWGRCPEQAGVNPTVMIIDVSNSTSPNMLSKYAGEYLDCVDTSPVLYLQDDSLIYYEAFYLNILNVSDLTSPTSLLSADILAIPSNLVLSSDGKTAFVIDLDTSTDDDPISLIAWNLTDLNSIEKISSITLNNDINASALGALAISADNNYIFMAGEYNLMIINVSDIHNLTVKGVDTITGPTSVALSSDGRTLFAISSSQVTILELYVDSKLRQRFTLPENAVQVYTLPQDYTWGYLENMITSSDQNTAFVTFQGAHFVIFNLSNKTVPTILSVYDLTQCSTVDSITISPDEKAVFLACSFEISVLDISNLTSPTLISTLPADGFGGPQPFAISSDAQIAFISFPDGFQIVNISNVTAPINISMFNAPTDNYSYSVGFTLSQDEQSIFLLLWSEGNIYSLQTIDISELSNPRFVSSISIFLDDDDGPGIGFFSVSVPLDGKAAFIVLDNHDEELKVFDFSNPTSSMEVDWSDYNINTTQPVIISSDSSTAFIATDSELLVIDITRLKTPQILRSYSIPTTVSIFLSEDESIMYLAAENGTWAVVNLQPQYTLEMWNNDFVLGEVYSNTLEAFQVNKNKYLNPMEQNYSFTTMSLYSVTSLPGINSTETVTAYPLLPDWIEFDQSHGIVTFSPSTQDQIGLYQIYCAMSLMIPNDTFVGVANITNQTESLDLMVALMSLGYMNTQGFLTSSYDPNTILYLSSQYSSFEGDIRSKLASYYIEMTTSFAVDSSLSLSSSKHLLVNTQSENTISVTISISQGNDIQAQVQFVKGNYPIIATYSSDQSAITMEGTLTSINNALSELIINLNDNSTSCNGSIIVSDGVNPLLTKNVTNISSYFVLNQAPTIVSSIQDEINQAQIYTGDQFIIQINDTFVDPNGQDLAYSISMRDGTQVPDWLILRDSSLVGTPPEQVTDSEIDIIIIAKNQFKSSQQLGTLKIKISLLYALKLIATYGGAFITAVGLWIYMSTIHNIFCKKKYRYPKDLFIKVGDEQSVRNICSIAFIAKEIKASEIVLKEIKKAIARERNIKTLKNSHVADYFIDSQSEKLDEDKILEMTRDITLKLGVVDRDKYGDSSRIKGYLSKEVVQQVVLGKILNYQLSLRREKQTKKIYDKVQKYWISFIETTPDPLQYRLNRTELRKILKEKGIAKSYRSIQGSELSERGYINNAEDTIEVKDHQLSRIEEEPSLSLKQEQQEHEPNQNQNLTPLLQNEPKPKRSNINFDLLERLLIHTAFKYHNLDINAYDIRVVINQKPSGNSLWLKIKKAFKRDLAILEFTGKRDTAYGIRYEVKKNVLRFYGTPEEELKGETLAVQVTTKRGWILRELWLHCVAGSVKIENRNL